MRFLAGILAFWLALFPVLAQAEYITVTPNGSGSGSSVPCTTTASSLQYNNSGAFGCVSGWTTNGTTSLIGSTTAIIVWNSDTTIGRDGTAFFRHGATANGTPVAQTIGCENAAGTNIAAAATCTFRGPGATGTGTNGDWKVQTGVKIGTGVGSPTWTDALIIKGETQQAQFTNGTVGAPAITGSSLTSGIYFTNSGNQFNIGLSGTQYLALTTSNLFLPIALQLAGGSGGAVFLSSYSAANTMTISTSNASTGDGSGNLRLTNLTALGTVAVNGITTVTNVTDASASSGSGAFQVSGGASVAKRFWIPAISASSGLQTAVLCQSSGGEMIADSVACLASGSQFKNIIGPMENGALDKLAKLPMDRWRYKAEGQFTSDDWTRERIGPIAQDVAAMDPRIAGYDKDGNVRTFSTEQLLAFTIKAVQELNAKVNARQ